jgi:hypothetical protein
LLCFAEDGDNSLGGYITPEKTLILKEKLSEAYDKLTHDIILLPDFIKINELLKDNIYLKTLHELLEHYADFIFKNNLKECFSYSIRLINILTNLRDEAKRTMSLAHFNDRQKFFALENMIKSLQNHIWQESKRVLNLHDLRGSKLGLPEDVLDGLNKSFIPTWDFGPGKNPALNRTKRRAPGETAAQIMKRLLKENEEEAKKKDKK